MAEDSQQRILDQYDKSVDLYGELADKAKGLIEVILREEGIRVHTITSRLKERESLREKIARPDKNYAELSDLTDIAGIRIITYFEDDVDRVAECLEREFVIDEDNTIDKRKALDPDRFGYLTMQHIAEFRSDRTVHVEYARCSRLKFEVQTRSILQHAWAEMEHDLGYKITGSVPEEARRRFSRLAGLLEIADNEFRRLRDELENYRQEVPRRIASDPQGVEINKDSFSAFIMNSSLVAELDNAIASSCGANVEEYEEYIYSDFVERHVLKLKMFHVDTVEMLDNKLRQEKPKILAFATKWLAKEREEEPENRNLPFVAGVSIFYLSCILAGQSQDLETVKRFLDVANLYADLEKFPKALEILQVYDSISNQGS